MPTNRRDVSGWVGWVYFAGMLMVIIGIFQTIVGLVALLKEDFFVLAKDNLLAFDFTTWGWIHLILGVIVIAAGSAVINGRTWGRVIGVGLATLSAVSNFLFIQAYPIWSLLVILADILIIYALIVHGAEARDDV